MARKLLTQLRANATDGVVCLSAYKSTPAFQDQKTSPDPFRTIRVYRQDEPAFACGEDYAEYFDGLSWRDAEIVFEGPLPAGNHRKFAYTDCDVAVGMTYAYWMAGAEGEPAGPIGVKVRDPEVWWSQARVEREMARYTPVNSISCWRWQAAKWGTASSPATSSSLGIFCRHRSLL